MSATCLSRDGVNSYATSIPGGYVSTRFRESSAMVESPPWYFETMAFLDDVPGIAWESAANGSGEADRQHQLAVRWFSRRASAVPPEAAEPRASRIDEAQRRAHEILSLTIPAEGGRQFRDRADFGQCLDFLAEMTGDDQWDFLRRTAAPAVPPEAPKGEQGEDLGDAGGVVVETSGAELIIAERKRQVEAEGFTSRHDDEDHAEHALAQAAACYLLSARGVALRSIPPAGWPWADEWWKPSGDPVRDLVKAGALVAAEIDRLLRLDARVEAAEKGA